MNCQEECPFVMPCGDCFSCSKYTNCSEFPKCEVHDECKNCFDCEREDSGARGNYIDVFMKNNRQVQKFGVKKYKKK
jgi:hypothetical protein